MAPEDSVIAVHLPCPECRMSGRGTRGGRLRIGNRRSQCSTCNNFAQNVLRITRKLLAERHVDEYQRLRRQVEADLYPQVVERWLAEHPEAVEVES